MANTIFDTGTFIIDSDYNITSYNEEASKIFSHITTGIPCYKAIHGFVSPCPNCPVFTKQNTSGVYHKNEETGKDYYATFSNIKLDDGKDGYLVNNYERPIENQEEDNRINLMKRKIDAYRIANYRWAYLYFEFNVSKNVLVTDVYEVVDNVEISLDMTKRGFTTRPILFSDFVKYQLSRSVFTNRELYQEMATFEYLNKAYEEGKKSVNVTFRAKSTNGYLTWHNMSYYPYKISDDGDLYALGVLSDIHYEMEKDTNAKRNEEVMQSLIGDYKGILYYDLTSGLVSIYKLPSDIEADIKHAAAHYKPDELWKFYIEKRVQNSDKDKIDNLSDPEYLKKVLDGKKSFSYIFRVGTETDYLYYEVKILRVGKPEDELKALVVGITDKNDSIVQQLARQRQLQKALVLAQKDALTGIRNRTAYDIDSEQLDKDIAEGKVRDFGIVVCDVNDLKYANDKYGHDKGDILLINASKLICDTFKHSMVYRLGGDEFVVILRNADYENRNALLKTFRNTVLNNEKKKVPSYMITSVASGLAIYNPNTDKKCEDVFNRADTLMYKNKATHKKLGKKASK